MKKLTLFLAVLLICNHVLLAQKTALLINTYNRSSTSLNGQWNYIVDPYENGYYNYRYEPFDQQENPGKGAYFLNAKADGPTDLVEYNFDKSESMAVPSDWNSQSEKLFYYEGTVWYKKSFDYKKQLDDNRVFVYFGAVNYQADVYMNGKKLGTHIGGFTPFNYEVTNLLKEKDNFLVVKVDNKRKKEGVPTLNTDWWNYGGITREVKLVETGATYIADYVVQLDPSNAKLIKGFVTVNGKEASDKNVELRIPELGIHKKLKTDKEGKVSFEIKQNRIEYWSTNNPKLYDVEIEMEGDKLKDQIGFRTIRTKGSYILLNEEQVFLKGISIHEESPFREGRAYTKEDAVQLLEWAKELGCNFVRLAHYPHNEHMVRLADQMGLLVWEENPVYWTIDWENAATYENAENQLKTVISRDKNRASVIIWSMANETPNSEARNIFLKRLAKTAKQMDPTRLISAALEQSAYQDKPNVKTISDPFADVVDVLSFNQYIGWYGGTPETCKEIQWVIEQDKPVFISEFGAGAKQGLHGDKGTRWTEEYQAYLYEETLKMLSQIEQFQGCSPWILVDFRSPRRPLPEIQDGWNRKGLISEDGKKKQAFSVLQAFYNNQGLQKK
ncbi:glycoside hydrolase family 2 TIM barrel-domain containing protein [Limibacter armeniacum]|uniref:glycoside hydrolase family 2 protein n=1 Tax=Limibacter armeniacum TaxID=466084 RepID=UPI002FE5CE1E